MTRIGSTPSPEMNTPAAAPANAPLVQAALMRLGVPAHTLLTQLDAASSTVYRVMASDGAAYALRVTPVSEAPAHERESLHGWLIHLAQAGLRVPLPASAPLDFAGWRWALYHWVSGESLPLSDYTTAHVMAVGRAAAHLHIAAEGFAPPEGFRRPRLDAAALFGKAAADGTPSQYASSAEDTLFTASQQALLDEARARVQATFDALTSASETWGLIHADLIVRNIVFDGGPQRIGLLDFDECAFGLYLYDLTPLLWLQRNAPDYAALHDALWQGYTSVRPQPVAYRDHLPTLVAARHVASCRWLAANAHKPALRDTVRDLLADRFTQLAGFLTSGGFAPHG